MKLLTVLYCILLSGMVSCGKKDLLPVLAKAAAEKPVLNQAVEYVISTGQHYCDKNILSQVNFKTLSFTAVFDSSAIYTSVLKENQYDINKLYGFSDNGGAHHVNSARFGWRWSDQALRIFAYVYNNEKMISKELGVAKIGTGIDCSITVKGDEYIFNLDGAETKMPRTATTATGIGYRLYPYFGGDEVAPHNIKIVIKEQSAAL